jgi:NitT/TauT family transport system substrate-binding protein
MTALSPTRRAFGLGILAAYALGRPGAAADLRLSFILNGRVEGPAAPYFLAFERGYYQAERLNVGIESTAGSNEAIARVAAGAEMGVADINMLMRYRDRHPDAPVTAVFMVYNRPAFAVVGRKSRGVAKPKDLEGRRLGAAVPGASATHWPIFVKTAGIDASKVTVETIGLPVREPLLAAGQIDAVTGQSLQVAIGLQERGVPADDIAVMLMADFGVELYGDAVIVNSRFAAEQPEAVRGFLRALVKGLKETARSPAAGIAAVLKRNDSANKDAESARLALAIRDNFQTAEVRANGYGAIDAARMSRAIGQLAAAMKFDGATPTAEAAFDPSFLPDAADRRAD